MSVPTVDEAGEWLVTTRASLRTLREASDKRLQAAGEAWGAALGAMVAMLQRPDASEDEKRLRAMQMSAYSLEGAQQLQRYLTSSSVALPDEAAEIARRFAEMLKRASAGDESALEGADQTRQKAQALLDELSQAP